MFMDELMWTYRALEQGTSERLSKRWMPLDEYTKQTMEGLLRGDLLVGNEPLNPILATYEQPKVDHVFSNKPMFDHKK